MAEIIMNNVREKLSKAREKCVGMSEEVYAVTDYMSVVANDTLYPEGIAVILALIMDDVQRGRTGFASFPDKELPVYLREHKNQVLTQMPYVLQVIDEIAEPEFAKEVRNICKQIMNWNPPKRSKAELDDSYPAYVKVAVDWWANAIASPKLDNGDEMPFMLMQMISATGKSYSEEEVKLFKTTLAEGIINEMKEYGRCTLRVDYHPCDVLAEAGGKIGVSSMSGWPWKTTMYVSEKKVEVYAGYGAPNKILWTE